MSDTGHSIQKTKNSSAKSTQVYDAVFIPAHTLDARRGGEDRYRCRYGEFKSEYLTPRQHILQ